MLSRNVAYIDADRGGETTPLDPRSSSRVDAAANMTTMGGGGGDGDEDNGGDTETTVN